MVGVKAPVGSSKNSTSLKVLDYSKDSLMKRSIITIRHSDDLCCGRALAVALPIINNQPKLKQLKQGKAIQKREALKLYKRANGLPGPCSLSEINKFQRAFPGDQIIVIDYNAHNTSIYEGPRGNKNLVLYKSDDHYNIVNPKKLRFLWETIFL